MGDNVLDGLDKPDVAGTRRMGDAMVASARRHWLRLPFGLVLSAPASPAQKNP